MDGARLSVTDHKQRERKGVTEAGMSAFEGEGGGRNVRRNMMR